MKPLFTSFSKALALTLCAVTLTQAARAEVSPLRAAQIEQLQAWGEAGRIETPSPLNLDVRAADLEAARATQPLQEWVQRGGVVILHTDAAGAFGFQTVQVRERSFDRAGQKWGKSTNALPFGGSPLLLGGRSASRIGQTDGVPGVRTVFYQLEGGDALLRESGPAVIPLLRVEYNTAPARKTTEPTLYAAAMRRYGEGWALFVPRTIGARADGARFQANLQAFIAAASAGEWLSLPVSAIQNAYVPASRKQRVDWQRLREALRLVVAPKQLPPVSDEAQLVLSLSDAKALDSAWAQADAAPRDDGLQESARALVYLLSARAAWQQDSDDGAPVTDIRVASLWRASSSAREALWKSQEGGPAANMTRWWCGVLALGAALPPVPRKYEPELIEFSYARPALEAVQWWQGVNTSDPVVSLAGQAAVQMAKQHKDDPPLLSYWKTDSGTRYWMQLAPIQAASDRFLPSPKEWGMPQQDVDNKDRNLGYLYRLIPLGSEKAMPLNIVPHPIIYPEANTVRPRMYLLCSQIWSGTLVHNWKLQQQSSFILLSPEVTKVWKYVEGTSVVESTIAPYREFLSKGKIYSRYPLHHAMPSWEAFLKQKWIQFPNAPLPTEQDYRWSYIDYTSSHWVTQEFIAQQTPARVARLQSHLLATFWSDGEAVPQWMDDGLQNLFSLDMGEVIRRNSYDLRAITPFPTLEQALIRHPRAMFASEMLPHTLRESLTSTDPEVEPVESPGREHYGLPLTKLDSTRRVQYFYAKYGAGAFVETLQRLGSGENIDQALQATIGLTQSQFFAAADAA